MKRTRILLIIVLTSLCFFSCKKDSPAPSDPVTHFLGDYHMDCLCNDQGTPQDDSIPDTFFVHLTEIPSDTMHIRVQNVHNLGELDTVEILSTSTFDGDYITGTLHAPDSLFLYYLRNNLFCGGWGTK